MKLTAALLSLIVPAAMAASHKSGGGRTAPASHPPAYSVQAGSVGLAGVRRVGGLPGLHKVLPALRSPAGLKGPLKAEGRGVITIAWDYRAGAPGLSDWWTAAQAGTASPQSVTVALSAQDAPHKAEYVFNGCALERYAAPKPGSKPPFAAARFHCASYAFSFDGKSAGGGTFSEAKPKKAPAK